MVTCCIHGCSSRSGRDKVHFFRIPSSQKGCPATIENSTRQRATWLARISRQTITDATVTRNTVVCSKHFICGAPAKYMDVTNPDWAPSLHLGHEIHAKPNADRFRRCQNRAVQRRPLGELTNNDLDNDRNEEDLHDRATLENVDEAENVGANDENIDVNSTQNSSVSCQTDVNQNSSVSCQTDVNQNSTVSCQTYVNQNSSVSCQTDLDCFALKSLSKPAPFSEEHLSVDKKCRFYTGVPSFAVLKLLFDLVAPHIKKDYTHGRVTVTKFQEFASVLVRLRLNLLEEDIADRLEISQSCYSKYFNLWIPVMSQCFSCLIVWPDRETLQKTMPECFLNAFGRSVAVIIDCFETRTAVPSGLLAKAQTHSHYKKHSTVKFLIGATPQGTVSYISPAWGGRTSDKFITEHSSGFLDKLLPGDVILADRGFDIGAVIGGVMARVITPAYMHQRTQLASDDVESSRRIANVRIHVERVIGLVRRKYKILDNKLNYSFLQSAPGSSDARIDDVVLICCALSNLSSPIVPMSDNPKQVD